VCFSSCRMVGSTARLQMGLRAGRRGISTVATASTGGSQNVMKAMSARLWCGGPLLRLSTGDITEWRGDVLVNCANETYSFARIYHSDRALLRVNACSCIHVYGKVGHDLSFMLVKHVSCMTRRHVICLHKFLLSLSQIRNTTFRLSGSLGRASAWHFTGKRNVDTGHWQGTEPYFPSKELFIL